MTCCAGAVCLPLTGIGCLVHAGQGIVFAQKSDHGVTGAEACGKCGGMPPGFWVSEIPDFPENLPAGRWSGTPDSGFLQSPDLVADCFKLLFKLLFVHDEIFPSVYVFSFYLNLPCFLCLSITFLTSFWNEILWETPV
ncbi:MAG: hypothetical protein V8S58_15135 [Lachnospiraceae bacterium]